MMIDECAWGGGFVSNLFIAHKSQGDNVTNQVLTRPTNPTLLVLKGQLDDGEIKPDPDYQRDYVFNDKQASKLIESILMCIPIPNIFLSEEDDGYMSVIDGQQRLVSIYRFLSNKFALCGLEELSELNGMKFKTLPQDVQRRLKSSSLSCVTLLKESSHLKYEIFARLNVGSVKLKPQELRNCVYRGSFNTMLEDIAASSRKLKKLFHDDNKRKAYQERILRFFALCDYRNYKSSLSKTMNAYMEAHRNDSPAAIEKHKYLFLQTIDLIFQVLGESAFDAWDRQSKKLLTKFSGSVYDSIIVPLSFFQKRDIIRHADEIRGAINNLKLRDNRYQGFTYAATGSKHRVIGRIELVWNTIYAITGGTSLDQRTFSEKVKRQLWHEGIICAECGNKILSIDDAEVDHRHPFILGGATEISNAQLLHKHCNRAKGARLRQDDLWQDAES